MAEYIDRKALLAQMEERQASLLNEYGYRDHYTRGFEEAVDKVQDFPTADVVEVVRCKDCKHFGGVVTAYTCRLHSTGHTRIQMNGDSFCSYGERRNNDIHARTSDSKH